MLALDECHKSMQILKGLGNQSQTQAETKFLHNRLRDINAQKVKKSMFWSGSLNALQNLFILLWKKI